MEDFDMGSFLRLNNVKTTPKPMMWVGGLA